jgi:hypothetical protein
MAGVRLTVTTDSSTAGRHVLALDLPHDELPLHDLQELARTLAETAGMLGGHTHTITLRVRLRRRTAVEGARDLVRKLIVFRFRG